MRWLYLCAGLLVFLGFSGSEIFAQCTTSDATSCVCEDSTMTDCDLLPDIIVGEPPLLVSGSSGYIEYSQTGNGVNDGRLRVSVSTPNIGHGPLTVRTTAVYVCGIDTFYNQSPGVCPDGSAPKQLINQRVYHKTGSVMTFYDRPAGSMTYHPGHGHMHVDDWGVYTLRIEDPNDPDPLNWQIVGTGSKLAFCLMDYGSCSTYSGHCVDSAGNVLENNDFPNYGLGGGSYTCSPVEQGISSGWTDIYYQYLNGMWINIPPGTCNGDYMLVIQLDPYDYFLEENENNNVLAVPITLTQQVPLGGISNITNVGPLNVCPGDTVTLTANPGSSYLWSNGETTQTIQTTNPGSYTVTVTSQCGTAVSSPLTVTNSTVNPPVTSGDTVCVMGQATLTAMAASGVVSWYDALVGGQLVGTGSTFMTPVINTTTSYYAEVEEVQIGLLHHSPPHDSSFGGGSNHTNATRFLRFNVYSDLELVSVKVYADGSAPRVIELRDANNNVIQSVTTFIPDGESRVSLNFQISPGNGYKLGVGSTPNLFRNDTGVNYPYSVSGLLDITGSSVGGDYYYFFYDWEVQEPDYTCISAREEALAFVDNCVGINEDLDGLQFTVFPNPTDRQLFLTLTGQGPENAVLVSISDLAGRVVHRSDLSFSSGGDHTHVIDVSELRRGMYFLLLSNGVNTRTIKVMID